MRSRASVNKKLVLLDGLLVTEHGHQTFVLFAVLLVFLQLSVLDAERTWQSQSTCLALKCTYTRTQTQTCTHKHTHTYAHTHTCFHSDPEADKAAASCDVGAGACVCALEHTSRA